MRAPAGLFLLGLALVAACRGGDAVAPRAGPPAALVVISRPTSPVAAGESAGQFAVRVADAAGAAVAGALVRFSAEAAVSVAIDSARTDANGEARTAVSAGTSTGSAAVTATVDAGAAVGRATVVVVPGPAVRIVVSPKAASIFYTGDSLQLAAVAEDEYGNRIGGGTLTYTVTDETLLRVSAAGLLTALRQDGATTVVVSAGGNADTASITVTPSGVTPCTGAAAPRTLGVGELTTFNAVSAGCLTGGASGAEYALVAFNSSLDGSTSLSATVRASGLAPAPTTPIGTTAVASALVPVARGAAALIPDEAFHVQLHERARAAVAARAVGARRWFAGGARAATGAVRLGDFVVRPSYSAIPSSPAVGDLVQVNVNAKQDCTIPAYRAARVVALGTRAMVLADTLNPADGFTTADYERYAARFDTLVYPLDVSAFGEPTDIDGNGRIAVLFTRAVNELTAASSSSFVAGFFYGRDLLPTSGAGACEGSNAGELVYMLVPDPAGAVNGNVRRTGFVDSLTTSVLAHELQHLINSSRRLYVNTGAATDEAVWLNEGLSHVAEELLYYRESGQPMRRDLGDAAVRLAAPETYPLFKADLNANFSRLLSYLRDPGTNSPTASDDQLATRGATWSFLRYVVDQLYSSDGDVWRRFDDSRTTGVGTLQAVFGAGVDLPRLFRDWTLANLLDDSGVATDSRFAHASWNYRSLFADTFGSYDESRTIFTPVGVALRVSPFSDAAAARVRVRGASAVYYRLAVASGREALLTFAAGQGVPDPALQFVVVRTR